MPRLVLSLLLLTQLLKVNPKPIPWLVDGRYAPEGAIYELQCATTQKELCEVLGVNEYSGSLSAARGVLHYDFDAEPGHQLFLPDAVTAESAEGILAAPAVSPDPDVEYGGEPLTRMPDQHVRLWRDGENLVVRWAADRDRPGPEPSRIERFVPWARLRAAAEARAGEIGATVSACCGKTSPPPKRRCGIGPSGKPAR